MATHPQQRIVRVMNPQDGDTVANREAESSFPPQLPRSMPSRRATQDAHPMPGQQTTPPVQGRLGHETRVFGVGLNKTGTSSLKRCWEMLGIGPIPSQKEVARARIIAPALEDRNFAPALAFAEDYRGLEDRPWNVGDIHHHLHQRFPDSLFVLTVRDEEAWWQSVYRWITVEKPIVQKRYLRHFEVDEISRAGFIEAYRRHNAAVLAYFENTAPDRLLVLEIGAGDEWQKICAFFERPVPPVPFPHVNRQAYSADRLPTGATASNRIALDRCAHCDRRLGKRTNPKRKTSEQARQGPKAATTSQPSAPTRLGVRSRFERWRADRHVRRLTRAALAPKSQAWQNTPRPLAQMADEHELGVVTCYFNPAGSEKRLVNYYHFAECMRRAGVPLLTVELAFHGHDHHIDSRWGEVYRVKANSVMWQKERLLNLAIELMVAWGYRKIAWLDADIEFIGDEWPQRIVEALDRNHVCQVFSDALIHRSEHSTPAWSIGLARYYRETGELLPNTRLRTASFFGKPRAGTTSGFGWAARAEVLAKVPLYENAVIGGGDKLIYFACLAHEPQAAETIDRWFASSNTPCSHCGHVETGEQWQADYLAWAERWNQAMEGKLGYANNVVSDLFHGALRNRHYTSRNEVLLRARFDPTRDLRIGPQGSLEWASNKPELRDDLISYFDLRNDS